MTFLFSDISLESHISSEIKKKRNHTWAANCEIFLGVIIIIAFSFLYFFKTTTKQMSFNKRVRAVTISIAAGCWVLSECRRDRVSTVLASIFGWYVHDWISHQTVPKLTLSQNCSGLVQFPASVACCVICFPNSPQCMSEPSSNKPYSFCHVYHHHRDWCFIKWSLRLKWTELN